MKGREPLSNPVANRDPKAGDINLLHYFASGDPNRSRCRDLVGAHQSGAVRDDN